MNLRRGLLRAWLVLSICWMGAIAYQDSVFLCASYSVKEHRLPSTGDPMPAPGTVLTPLPAGPKGWERFSGPSGCFPRGEYRADWAARWVALSPMLSVPASALIVGLLLIWIGSGFRSKP